MSILYWILVFVNATKWLNSLKSFCTLLEGRRLVSSSISWDYILCEQSIMYNSIITFSCHVNWKIIPAAHLLISLWIVYKLYKLCEQTKNLSTPVCDYVCFSDFKFFVVLFNCQTMPHWFALSWNSIICLCSFWILCTVKNFNDMYFLEKAIWKVFTLRKWIIVINIHFKVKLNEHKSWIIFHECKFCVELQKKISKSCGMLVQKKCDWTVESKKNLNTICSLQLSIECVICYRRLFLL